MGYLPTGQSLVECWACVLAPPAPYPVTQPAPDPIAPCTGRAWLSFAVRKPGTLGLLTPNDHSVTRGEEYGSSKSYLLGPYVLL